MNDKIKEVALRVARDMWLDGYAECKNSVEFLTRCLAELSKSAEPVAWMHPEEGLSYENHYSGNIPLYTRPQTIEAAVLQEREECAALCDEQYPYSVHHTDVLAAKNCAAAIRARKP
jgi:hypothetical protein